ncbi:serine/threonine-protein phosphatase 6 regulatory ankyrin repeat subunit B [Lingula anatina]|uniref:Serine/threonine-protein phosphatase 6 regulatory ankyrin repeat subunit B n=1 Tax=Lingula anatina TaxID=7574 RepID=A0A1S3K9S3_LINAN|nr:serine/threonine-protein phosphatase 6 regulatory ankyrin repeat subunit B [Lingula anatina]|eukprot:XP_013419247.1 serine/threonine-protein phosphatase 6 regulatory ankyrin repeat subunit B [Lingula anatina]
MGILEDDKNISPTVVQYPHVRLFDAIRGGDMKSLRGTLDGIQDKNLQELMTQRCNETYHIRRPSSARDVYIHNATPVVAATTGWYPDVLEHLAARKYGLDEGCAVDDTTNSPVAYDKVTALMIAAMSGKLRMVQTLVNNGASINLQNSLGDTALLEACFEGHLSVVQHLVEAGADMHVTNQRGVSSLMLAAYAGNKHVVEYLLSNGVDKQQTDKLDKNLQELMTQRCNETYHIRRPSSARDVYIHNATPVVAATTGWYPDVLEHLAARKYGLDEGCAVDDTTNSPVAYDKVTALMIAAMSGKLRMVQTLVNNGATINLQNSLGDTALLEACFEGHLSVVQHLVEAGADMHVTNQRGVSSLMLAAYAGNKHVVEYLLSNGVDKQQTDKLGRNCLFYSVSAGHLDCLQMLLNKGVKPQPDFSGVTILMEGCYHGHTAIVLFLMQNAQSVNINITEKDKNGRNALYYCCEGEQLELFDTLTKKGVPIEYAAESRNLLMLSALKPNVKVMEHLLKSARDLGIDINEKDTKGRNCLFYCATSGDVSVFQLLIKYGVKIENSNDGVSLLMQASGKGQQSLTQYLLDHADTLKIDTCAKDKDGWNCLFYGVAGGHVDICRKLIANDIPVEEALDGRSILMQAIARNDSDMAQFILDNRHLLQIDLNQRDHDGWNAAFYSAQVNNLDMLKLLVKKGALLTPTAGGTTVLMHCAERGLLNFITYLVDRASLLCVELSARDKEGNNALFYSVKGGKIDACQLLIKQGIAVECNFKNQTILMTASSLGHREIVKYLLENDIMIGLDINKKDDNGQNALYYASSAGYVEILESLLLNGVGVTDDINGKSLLMVAAEKGHVNVLEYLLNHSQELGLKVNATDAKGENALFYALKSGCTSCIKLLLRNEVKVLPNVEGKTILAICTESQYQDILQVIIECSSNGGSFVNFKDVHGRTALHHMAIKGQVNLLRRFGHNYDRRVDFDDQGDTILISACRIGNMKAVKYIVSQMHVDVNAKTKDGRTALFTAIDKRDICLVQFLIEHGATFDIDNDGRTVLMAATETGSIQIVDYLLNQLNLAVRKINVTDANGRNVMHYCALTGDAELLSLLSLYGSSIDSPDNNLVTPAMEACRNGHMFFLSALLKRGIKVNAVDHQLRDALHHCCEADDPKLTCVRLLIQEGIDVNSKDINGETPLMKVCRRGLYLMAKCLLDNGADPIAKDKTGKEALDHCPKDGNIIHNLLEKYACMDKHHRSLIEMYKTDLLSIVEVTKVIPALHQAGIVSTPHYISIMQKSSHDGRIELLLDILRHRGSQAYDVFCRALLGEPEYQELAYQMMSAAYITHKEVYV